MNVKQSLVAKKFILLLCVITALCCLIWGFLLDDYASNKPFRFMINASRHFNSDWVNDPYVLLVSEYRQRFLLWYFARPDIAERIGADTGTNATQYIIYRCDNDIRSYCGGWADRIKGMVAAYMVANLTGRNFKVEMLAKGCDLTEYLIPNLVNWALPISFHKSLSKLPNDTNIVNFMNQRIFNSSQLNLTNLIGPKRFVYFRTNLYHNMAFKSAILYENELSWLKKLTQSQIMATLYKRLFVLHPRIQSRLQYFLHQTLPTPQHKLICAHVRLGQNPTIPRDVEVRNSPKNLFKVWEFIEEHSKTDMHKVFIMADSTQTLDEARNQSFMSRIVENPGPIIHVEQYPHEVTKSDMCRAVDKIVFDQHLLMNCDVLMISHSGLSQLAAFVRASHNGLYCFLTSGIIVPCTTETIFSLYTIH